MIPIYVTKFVLTYRLQTYRARFLNFQFEFALKRFGSCLSDSTVVIKHFITNKSLERLEVESDDMKRRDLKRRNMYMT